MGFPRERGFLPGQFPRGHRTFGHSGLRTEDDPKMYPFSNRSNVLNMLLHVLDSWTTNYIADPICFYSYTLYIFICLFISPLVTVRLKQLKQVVSQSKTCCQFMSMNSWGKCIFLQKHFLKYRTNTCRTY